MKKTLLLLAGLASLPLLSGCPQPIGGLISSDERRIWVIRNFTKVYRCADASGPDSPPRPVCVPAAFADERGD